MFDKIRAWMAGASPAYVRWGIIALMAIVALVLALASGKGWFFWTILVLAVVTAWYFRIWALLPKAVTIVAAIVFGLIIYNQAGAGLWPSALPVDQTARSFSLLLPTSWWDSAKRALTGGDEAATNSQGESSADKMPPLADQSTNSSPPAGCPAGFVCVPASTISALTPQADQTPLATGKQEPIAQQEDQKDTTAGADRRRPAQRGYSLRELMIRGSSKEALAMSRRFSE